MAKGYLQNLLEENIDDKLKIDPSGWPSKFPFLSLDFQELNEK